MTVQAPIPPGPTPRPPAHLARIVEALGQEQAITFLLAFGGAELYVPAAPKGRSRLEEVLGLEGARALAAIADHLPRRIPTGKRWIAAIWRREGLSVAEIARRLHVTDVTVRSYLRTGPTGDGSVSPDDPRQPRLL